MTGKRKIASLTRQADGKMPAAYATTFAEIKERIRRAQYAALKSVNKQLVGLYWDIGRIVVERQASEGWGRSVVETLAGDLQREFPGVGGFSASNLWRMKAFHETYRTSEKLAPLVREIAWSHNLVILERCSDNPRTGILPAHDPQVRLVEECVDPSDRKPELREKPVRPDQFR